MKRELLLLVLILTFIPFVLMAMGPDPQITQKPSSPLSLSITEASYPGSDITSLPGGAVELVITLRSQMDAKEIKLKVRPTGGAEMIEGPPGWTGPVKAGEPVSIRVVARASEGGSGGIEASALLKGERGRSAFSARARYRFGSEGSTRDASKSQSPRRRNSLGEEIMEYRAK